MICCQQLEPVNCGLLIGLLMRMDVAAVKRFEPDSSDEPPAASIGVMVRKPVFDDIESGTILPQQYLLVQPVV